MVQAQRSARALVIDPDPVARSTSAQALRAADFVVTETADPGAALALLPSVRPDLILIDVELPGRDGIALCNAILHLPSGTNAAIVITTWIDRPGLVARAFEAGASDVVRQPIDAQLLAYRSNFLVRSNQAQRELRSAMIELQQGRAWLADAQRIAGIGSWHWEPESDVFGWSEHAQRILPLPLDSPENGFARYLSVVHAEDAPELEKRLATSAAEGTPLDSEHRVALAGGVERRIHLRGELQWDVAGRGLLVGTVQDITALRESEEQIHRLANYDALTALPNRALLTRELERELGRARERRERSAVLALGLDRFRRVNDVYGPALADGVLRTVAKRIVATVRSAEELAFASGEASISRIGGDEFLIALGGVTAVPQVEAIAQKLLRSVGREMGLGKERLEMTATIGAALFPEDGHEASRLVQNAIAAMQQAKRSQRGGYRFYSAQLSAEASRSLEVERWLRRALETGEGLLLEYQPQLDSQGGHWVGVEALVRMRSPDGQVISPGEFIAIAEETGLIVALGEWVLQTACRTARDFRWAGSPLRIAVNLSSHQLRQAQLLDLVTRVLAEHALPAQRLELEITESAFVEDVGAAAETLTSLRRIGVRIALDDFGTGFSTLANLMRLPIDALKIDRSFVRGIETEDHARAVIAAVIGIARRLGLTVVAEGVENEAQELFLRSERCEVLQGFRHGRPMAPEAIQRLLTDRW
jgi:diguanylate cyclase (GGDEF)-like protein